jgi:hypothetical protein
MASLPVSPMGSDHYGALDEDDETAELSRLLGVDDVFTEGQIEAEKWLQERRRQEQEDEELARRLQSQWEETLPDPSNESSPARARPSWSIDPANTGMGLATETQSIPPPYGSQVSRPGSVSAFGSSWGALPFHQRPGFSHTAPPFSYNGINMTPRTPTSDIVDVDTSDGSDSDIAEISSNEFRPRRPYAHFPIHLPTDWPSTQTPNRPPPSIESARELMNNALRSTINQAKRMGLPYLSSSGASLAYALYVFRSFALLC